MGRRRDISSRVKARRAARVTHSAFALLLTSFVVAGCARGGSSAAENGGSESIGGNQNRAGEGASGGDVGAVSSGGSSNGGAVSTGTGASAGSAGSSGGVGASGGNAGITGGIGGGGNGGGAGVSGGSGGKSSAGSGGVTGGTAGKGGTSSAGAAVGGLAGSGGVGTRVTVDGPRVLVDGRAFHIRGVCWNPVPKGKTHPAGLDFAGFADRDIPLMQQAGINVVRTYEPLTDLRVLDKLQAAGIRVLDSVYVYGGDAPSVVSARVAPIKNHPAILMWLVGNEWNYNGLYVDLPHDQALARLNEAAALLRAADPTHPIATVYGELPSVQTIAAMPNIDAWGINAYRGLGFGDLFSVWHARSSKPMFLAEYGADAYNATAKKYDPESQAMAVTALTRELSDNSAAFEADGITVGGALFEWADEWWKDSSGSPDQHDVGGVAPGGGPYPDQTFNEEWWGLVDIDRQPRAGYDALKAVLATLPK